MAPVLASWMGPSVKRDGLELPGVWLYDVAICRGHIPGPYTGARRRWAEPFPLTRCSWLYLSKL